jgi:micrococcal nuclease
VRGLLVGVWGGGALGGCASGYYVGAAGDGGRVTRVVDGDTLRVRVASGASERVRVLGIDTPEIGECGFRAATEAARELALGRRVALTGDPSQAARDRFERLLAYVRLPDGRDLGEVLLRQGLARVYVFDRPFRRLEAYRRAEAAGRARAVCRGSD